MIVYQKALILLNSDLFTGSFISLLKEMKLFNEVTGCKQLEEIEPLIVNQKMTHLFIDFDLQGVDMVSYIRELSVAHKKLYVIVISSLENSNLILKVKQAGAQAFISKKSGKKELKECLQTIYTGSYYLSPDIFNNAMDLRLNNKKEIFTAREHEILQQVISGKTITEIAALLNISHHTVVTHRRNMMKKLSVHNITALVKKAIEMGLI